MEHIGFPDHPCTSLPESDQGTKNSMICSLSKVLGKFKEKHAGVGGKCPTSYPSHPFIHSISHDSTLRTFYVMEAMKDTGHCPHTIYGWGGGGSGGISIITAMMETSKI